MERDSAVVRAITSTVDHADIRGLVTALLSSVAWAGPHSRRVHHRKVVT